jgi:hypothetical protein
VPLSRRVQGPSRLPLIPGGLERLYQAAGLTGEIAQYLPPVNGHVSVAALISKSLEAPPRAPSTPLTRSTHGPSIGISPSCVMPRAVKKAIAAATAVCRPSTAPSRSAPPAPARRRHPTPAAAEALLRDDRMWRRQGRHFQCRQRHVDRESFADLRFLAPGHKPEWPLHLATHDLGQPPHLAHAVGRQEGIGRPQIQ